MRGSGEQGWDSRLDEAGGFSPRTSMELKPHPIPACWQTRRLPTFLWPGRKSLVQGKKTVREGQLLFKQMRWIFTSGKYAWASGPRPPHWRIKWRQRAYTSCTTLVHLFLQVTNHQKQPIFLTLRFEQRLLEGKWGSSCSEANVQFRILRFLSGPSQIPFTCDRPRRRLDANDAVAQGSATTQCRQHQQRQRLRSSIYRNVSPFGILRLHTSNRNVSAVRISKLMVKTLNMQLVILKLIKSKHFQRKFSIQSFWEVKSSCSFPIINFR